METLSDIFSAWPVIALVAFLGLLGRLALGHFRQQR
jgi:hypothetical protein